MSNLSEHFTESEFIVSDTAIRKGISNNFNKPRHRQNAIILCKDFLEPIRQKTNSSIIITSGYRSLSLNRLIGGASGSQHCIGNAVDFKSSNVDLKHLFNLIIDMNLPYDQLIWEFGSWIHLSRSDSIPRKQIFEAKRIGKKVIYTPITRKN